MSSPTLAVRRSQLQELLKSYGPYRRAELHKKLLSAAEECRADAAHLSGRAPDAGAPGRVEWEARALEFEQLAADVASFDSRALR